MKPEIPHKRDHADSHKTSVDHNEDHPSKTSATAAAVPNVPHRTRRISQFSKEIPNLGHSHSSHAHQAGSQHHNHGHGHHHHHHHTEHSEHPSRRISHHSHTTSEGDRHERQRRISHHNRDGGHKDKGGHGHHGRTRAGSKREHDRHSVATSGDMNPMIEYENTYKLEPDAIFFPDKVKAIIKEVLEDNLNGQTYKANLMASRCMALSDIIKERVRQLEMPRFKTVVLVLVGENKDQALSVASLCLWNKATDNFASCEYSAGNLHVVAMVFGVYQE